MEIFYYCFHLSFYMSLIKYHIIKIVISYNHPARLLALNIYLVFICLLQLNFTFRNIEKRAKYKFFIKVHPFMISFMAVTSHICDSFSLHSSGKFVDASSSQEKGAGLRPTYMLIALNRQNRDQHNETDNQRTPLGLPSRFHIIMSPVQPCGPRHTVAHRPPCD